MTLTALGPRLVEVGAPIQLSPATGASAAKMDVARLQDGRIVVVQDGGGVNADGTGIRGQFLDANGAPVAGSGFALSQFALGRQSDPDVAALADGGFVAVWTSELQDGFGSGIYGRVFNADGTPRGAEFQVSDDAAESQSGAHVRATPDGGFAVGWNPVMVRFFDAAGEARGPAVATPTGGLGPSTLEDVWVDAAGDLHVLTRAPGGDGPNAPVELRRGLSEVVVDHDTGLAGPRVWLDPNPDPSGNFNDMQVELFGIAGNLAVARYYSAPGNFRSSLLMVSLVDPGHAGFAAEILPAQSTLVEDHYPIPAPKEAGFVALANGHILMVYGDSTLVDTGSSLTILYGQAAQEYRVNDATGGHVLFTGAAMAGERVTADLSGLTDADGLGSFALQWRAGGQDVDGATGASLDVTEAMIGKVLSLRISYTDGAGTAESALATMDGVVTDRAYDRTGTPGPDFLEGGSIGDRLTGLGGDDTILAYGGNDTVYGGGGSDRLNLGDGDDLAYGGSDSLDLRDVVYGGGGADTIDGGYGNDLLYGGDGGDSLVGWFGADELLGQGGNDTIAGGALSDLIYGGDGDDMLNGGFGHDRLAGGAGADSFLHMGLAGHGSDWVQDYSAAQGDRLVFGNDHARASDFQVNFARTPEAGAANVAEAFVIYRPTGQILWALVDGAAQPHIYLAIDGVSHDLLA